VLFTARASETSAAAAIERALKGELGLDTDVLVRTAAQLAPLVASHAFAGRADGSRLHIVFLRDAPAKAKIAAIDRTRSPRDEIEVRGREIHWHTPDGAGQSKYSMAYFERVLGTPGTTRNLNTVTKLLALLEA